MGVPIYRNGCSQYILFAADASTANSAPAKAPIRNLTPEEDANLWDASSSAGRGYSDKEAGQKSLKLSFEIVWPSSKAAPIVEPGGIYYLKGYVAGDVKPYEGTFIVEKADPKPDIKGDLIISVVAHNRGVYNSPHYPTAIADAAANSGRFGANFAPSYAPNTTATGADTAAVTNANGS